MQKSSKSTLCTACDYACCLRRRPILLHKYRRVLLTEKGSPSCMGLPLLLLDNTRGACPLLIHLCVFFSFFTTSCPCNKVPCNNKKYHHCYGSICFKNCGCHTIRHFCVYVNIQQWSEIRVFTLLASGSSIASTAISFFSFVISPLFFSICFLDAK